LTLVTLLHVIKPMTTLSLKIAIVCYKCRTSLQSCSVETGTRNASMRQRASVVKIPFEEIVMAKEPFARGGFGVVFGAEWRKENVVVKAIMARSEEERDDVEEETSITVCLRHPNVIKIFGITYIKSTLFGIVMEKAEHGSLDVWIGKIDHDKLTKIALGIVDGLQYVHSQNVIHRDIKPKNILMFGPKDDMIPKIADFGVAKQIQTFTAHTKVGQDLYMAPEVRLHLRYDFAADIFSLAMTLFELFNEQLVKEAPDEVGRFILGVHCHGGRIGQIPESYKVPMYLRNVIERGWYVKPEERPPLSEYYSTIQGKVYF